MTEPQRPPGTQPVERPGTRPPVGEAGPLVPTPESTDVPAKRPARSSRVGELWVGLIVTTVLLVLLLIFILQNSQTVQVDYFGLSGRLPLAVAILLGVVAGALLVAIPGTVRILQLRHSARRRR